MKKIRKYIESGILESFVLGHTSEEENREILMLASAHREIREEIDSISRLLETYAFAHAISPAPAIKPFVMAMIDYAGRLEKGEQPSYPPVLGEHSRVEDYAEWLERPDMQPPADFGHVYAKIIGHTPGQATSIVWVRKIVPPEVHTHEIEKFLMVEGTCDITVGESVYHLKPGDYFAIPLHEVHYVTVTSDVPCKAILQRSVA